MRCVTQNENATPLLFVMLLCRFFVPFQSFVLVLVLPHAEALQKAEGQGAE